MAVTILGGRAAAFSINLPAQVNFRPTSVMLRRKLFDAHQTWPGERFFDVCAGSGAVGMEAWSRGAESFFGEIHGRTLKLLATNLNKFMQRLATDGEGEDNFADSYLASHLINNQHREDFGLAIVAAQGQKNCAPLTIFFDPPYEELATLLPSFWAQVKKYHWQELWIESDRQKGLLEKEILQLVGQNGAAAQIKTVAAGTNFVVKVRANSHNADALKA